MRETSEGGSITRRSALAVLASAGLGLAASGLPMLAAESATDLLSPAIAEVQREVASAVARIAEDFGL